MSWYNNIISRTTSQLTSIQKRFLQGESDGDTEDDTHVCRVLRNYYTEKGQLPFPHWLPPDPFAPTSPPPGNAMAPMYAQTTTSTGGQPASGFSSLWGDSNANQQQRMPAEGPTSLRRGNRAAPQQQQQQQQLQQPSFSPYSPTGNEGGGAAPTTSANDRLRQRFGGAGAGAGRGYQR